MSKETTISIAAPTAKSDQPPRAAIEPCDPVLESIFSALGVDERYLDNDRLASVSSVHSRAAVRGADQLPSDSKEHEASPGGSDHTMALIKPWILHVDDDTDLSNALKLRLEAYGVSVVQAFDGMEGVRHAFTRPASAIILDHQMPRGDGEYVLRRLKQCEATMRIPIIVLTGRRDQGLEQRMLSLGANRFLIKPVRFDVMLEELRRFVPLREPRGEACLLA